MMRTADNAVSAGQIFISSLEMYVFRLEIYVFSLEMHVFSLEMEFLPKLFRSSASAFTGY